MRRTYDTTRIVSSKSNATFILLSQHSGTHGNATRCAGSLLSNKRNADFLNYLQEQEMKEEKGAGAEAESQSQLVAKEDNKGKKYFFFSVGLQRGA